MSRIIEARERLRRLAEGARKDGHTAIADEATTILTLMFRKRHAARVGARLSRPVTPEMSRDMAAMKSAHPDMPNKDIANHFGVNIGRVSEAVEKNGVV